MWGAIIVRCPQFKKAREPRSQELPPAPSMLPWAPGGRPGHRLHAGGSARRPPPDSPFVTPSVQGEGERRRKALCFRIQLSSPLGPDGSVAGPVSPGQVVGLHSWGRQMRTVCAATSRLDGSLGEPPSTSPDRGRLQAAVVICGWPHQVGGSKGQPDPPGSLFNFRGGLFFFFSFLSPLFPSPLSWARRSFQHAAPDPRRSFRLTVYPWRATQLDRGVWGAAAGERPPHSRFTAPGRSRVFSPRWRVAAALRGRRLRVGVQRRRSPPGASLSAPRPRRSLSPRGPVPRSAAPAPPRTLVASPVQGGRARRGRRLSISSAEAARLWPPF
ncbi:hypothetical protein NDU88_001909 [Pleurodeles waltl]|uniref:Uncharacterized protein n=1 Tax=Pleurodeles waltl TaxID=8319 RepID=A0AAV7KRC6_PLEWA|nr:hypothetical protein NDU88_001909 [Pleurodeles waltl]